MAALRSIIFFLLLLISTFSFSAFAAQSQVLKSQPISKTNIARLKLSAIPAKGGKTLKSHMFWWINSANKDFSGKRKNHAISSAAEPLFRLPAGNYQVVARFGKARKIINVHLKAGEQMTKVLTMNAGILKLSAISTINGPKLNNHLFWWLNAPKADFEGKHKNIISSSSAAPTFRLTAGQYQIKAKYGHAAAELNVVVKPGEITQQPVNFNAGRVKLAAIAKQGSQQPLTGLSWSIYKTAKTNAMGNPNRLATSADSQPSFNLPAGQYQVTVNYGNQKAKANLFIKAGKQLNKTIIFGAQGTQNKKHLT